MVKPWRNSGEIVANTTSIVANHLPYDIDVGISITIIFSLLKGMCAFLEFQEFSI